MSGDQLDLDAIEARANAATLGPWGRNGLSDVEGSVATFHRVGTTPVRDAVVLTDNQRDAEFIAHARADVPALIAEVRRLRAIETAVREVCTAELSGRSVEGALSDGDGGPWVAQKLLEVLRP